MTASLTLPELHAIRRDVVAADALAQQDTPDGRAEHARQVAQAQHAIAQIRLAMKHPALRTAKRWREEVA